MKDVSIYFKHILESINLIDGYISKASLEKFSKSVGMQDQVLYRLTIIGEAASNIPQEFRDQYPEVRWKGIVATRNLLIHEYFGVNVQEVWDIANKDLSVLKGQVEKMLKELDEYNQKENL